MMYYDKNGKLAGQTKDGRILSESEMKDGLKKQAGATWAKCLFPHNNGLPVEEFDQDDEAWQRLKDRRYSRLNMSRPSRAIDSEIKFRNKWSIKFKRYKEEAFEPSPCSILIIDDVELERLCPIEQMYSTTFRPPNPIFELLKNFTQDELLELSQYDDRIPIAVVLPEIKLEGLKDG